MMLFDKIRQDLPIETRKSITESLSKYSEGVPEDNTYQPLDWNSKNPIQLSKGDKGVMEYFSYITNPESSKAVYILSGILAVSTTIALVLILKNRLSPLINSGRIIENASPAVVAATTEVAATVTEAPIVSMGAVEEIIDTMVVDVIDAGEVVIPPVIYDISPGGALSVRNILDKEVSVSDFDIRLTYLRNQVKALAQSVCAKPSDLLNAKEMRELVKASPKDFDELATIKGFPINSKKVEQFGKQFLEWINIPTEELRRVALSLDDELVASFTPAPMKIMRGALE